MRVAFDMSSYMWTALFVGKDKEHGYEEPHPTKADKKVWVNGWLYGYENVINMMVSVLKQFDLAPIDTLLVFEGMHSKSKRRLIESTYKEGEEKAPGNYVEFEKLRAKMQEVWLGLGAQCIDQDFVEGDDILAYLAQHTEQDLVIATGDRDLTVLNGTNKYGAKVLVACRDQPLGENPYGPWELQLIPLHKALVGDTGDKIKGVVGFGESKWFEFIRLYGEDGCFELLDLLKAGKLGPLHAQAEECKLIKMICDQEAQCLRSYRLGCLHPEWVNTTINPLRIKAGMVREAPEMPDERLAQWYQKKVLITALNLEAWKKSLLGYVQDSPFVTFDIETSTGEESDEWIDRQNKNADPDEDRAVDVYGSELTGFSLTLGKNQQHTFYFPVNHAQTNNISREEARFLCEMPAMFGKRTVIQNVSFELCVMYNEFGADWIDNGYEGFLPDVDDTKLMNSYVDENSPLGLKPRSAAVLGYQQQTYDEVTLVDGVRKKMRELSAEHVFNYGCDDTICTAALYVHNRLIMELEHTWEIYREVEIDSAYQHAVNFQCGIATSVQKINELSKIDDETYDKAWATVRNYLIAAQYEGTQPPVYTELTPAVIKEAFEICCGRKLDSMMRILSKIVTYIREVENEHTFALLIENTMDPIANSRGNALANFNDYVRKHFKGEPQNPIGSPKQMQRLLYEIMKLPVRVRNKVTAKMRSEGLKEGTPKTDALAIEYALKMDATPEQQAVLESMKLMQMVRTRRSLYYTKWPDFQHWKDGLVRPNHNQCSTNTRRASESKPNKQQLPKHQKIEDQPARFREAIIPHRLDAVVVSMDFEAQELRIIAHWSGDQNLVACYVGTDLKDVHALTGLGVFNYKGRKRGVEQITYEQFAEIMAAGEHPLFKLVKEDRTLGKKVNFTTEFGAMAPKVAQTLLISEEEAQAFIDAREEQFPGVKAWKERVIADAKDKGYTLSMMGAVRHLRAAFTSNDPWESSKAERQAVNYKVQGSAAEQTKLAEGRMWRERLFLQYDAACYGAIHDEVVASVRIVDLYEFIPKMHACMIGHFADMSIPIGSSISFGPDFYRQIEIGNAPTASAIARGLEKMKDMLGQKEAA